jgi:2-oxoglutarate ferredoxin oxidoreductase subunit beta
MEPKDFEIMDRVGYDIAWCPGCGNFAIREVVKSALSELGLSPREVVMVSGIGQAAKMPHYIRVNYFNGLHGRSLPAAAGIKAANPGLTVIAESGDGCTYGEGGNHLTHTIARNPDVTLIAHNNMVYGLTKGQASPTSRLGFVTPLQPADRGGVTNEPFDPLAFAVALNASFVARAFIGDRDETLKLMKKAIAHKGFALLDIFQPCVTYNRVNTYQWYKENTYYLDDSHDPTDRNAAFTKAIEGPKFPLGVIYTNPDRPTFEDSMGVYAEDSRPLYERGTDYEKLLKRIRSLI